MVDLSLAAGLPISLGDDSKLIFGPGLPEVAPVARKSTDMADLWYQPDRVTEAEIYHMYRDVHMPEHTKLIRERGLRYDVTIILPGKMGSEFIKTAGHYHPVKPGTRVTYPEVYEVLYGAGHYLLQKADTGSGDIVDAVFIEAEAGQQVVIPPDYGHITINPWDQPLVMANWVAADFVSEYSQIKRFRGGAYFEIAETAGASRFVPNKRHEGVAPLRSLEPKDLPTFALISGHPMYQAFLQSPDRYRWLVEPERFVDELEFIISAPN
ncbi:MAG: glucose-6-phosphate isomerase [Firmicutes bacterium]|jgi:glucose-6-phosphate isomerase|nr:glucose-6-phosphate isomerase [Bacillota bacterium]